MTSWNDRVAEAARPHAGDAALDPIRYAVVTGAPLIVVSNGSLTSRVREALAVLGRSDTLREVRVGFDRSLPMDASARRIDPATVMPTAGWESERADALSRLFRQDVATNNFLAGVLPVFCLEEAVSGTCTVSIVADRLPTGNFLALWLLVEGTKRARREGTPPPVLVYDKPHDRAKFGIHGIVEGFGAGYVPLLGPGEHGAGVSCRPADAYTDAEMRRAREIWERRLAAFDAEAGIRRAGDLAYLSHEGRTIAAGTLSGRRASILWDITADGRCRSMCAEPGNAHVVERTLRLVRRGGVAALAEHGWRRADASIDRMFETIMAACEEKGFPDGERPSESFDAAFEEAVGGHLHYEPIAYLVRSDPATERARRDFVVTWPAFAGFLLDPAIRARIDAGERTVGIVAGHAGIGRPVARRLVGRRDIPKVNLEGAMPGARLMDAIGHDRLPLPDDHRGWNALEIVCSRLNEAVRPSVIDIPTVRRLLLGVPGRDWTERLRRLNDAGQARREFGRVQAYDMIAAFSSWLGRVRGRRWPDAALALSIMLEHASLLRIEDASARWHANAMLRQETGGLPLDLTWPVPFDPVDLGAGLRAVALDGVRALVDEGGHGPDPDGLTGLDHCVGGYGRRCQTGESLVVSIRRSAAPGERLATAEFAPHEEGGHSIGGRPYALRQYRGRANAPPPEEAAGALERLQGLLDAGRVPVRAEALEPRKPAEVADDARAVACFHPAWRRIMPPAYGALTLEGLLAKAEELDPPPKLDAISEAIRR